MPRTDADETPWLGSTTSAPAPKESAARLARDAVVHSAGYVASTVITFALVPFLLRHLSAADYGIWLVSLSASAALGTVAIALWWTVNREVAGAGEGSGDARTLVADAMTTTIVIGFAGGLLLALFGAMGWIGTPSSDEQRRVLLLAGPTFFFEQIAACASAVIAGRRRFVALSAITFAFNAMRAVSIVVVLAGGARVTTVALCHVTFTALSALALVTAMVATTPWLRPLRLVMPFTALRSRLRFASQLQLTILISTGTLQVIPLIVSRMFGPAAVVSLYIGQRIPQFASILANRFGEAAYPLLVQMSNRGGVNAIRDAVARGTRWAGAMAIPGYAALFVFAPLILRLWLGTYQPEYLVLFRLAAVAFLFETLALPMAYALTAAGRTGAVLVVAMCAAAVHLAGVILLLRPLGVRGAGIALLASCVVASLAYLVTAQQLGIARWRRQPA